MSPGAPRAPVDWSANPAPGEPGAVPEADDAWVVVHVCVPGVAGVAGEHRQPDRVHSQLRVRVGVEDVRADQLAPSAQTLQVGEASRIRRGSSERVLNSERSWPMSRRSVSWRGPGIPLAVGPAAEVGG